MFKSGQTIVMLELDIKMDDLALYVKLIMYLFKMPNLPGWKMSLTWFSISRLLVKHVFSGLRAH